jgi:pyruvate dehydrogenase E1 component beta subunit
MLWPLEGEVDETVGPLPLGKAEIVRSGSDVTLVSWSALRHEAVAAAETAAASGVSVEVIDLRTLWPWDREAVLASVARTRRLLVAHEAVQVGGFGAEIAATVAEALGGDLLAPVRRLGGPRVPVAYAPPMEAAFRVDAAGIAAAILEMTGVTALSRRKA